MMALGIDIELSRFWHQYKSTVATQTYILKNKNCQSWVNNFLLKNIPPHWDKNEHPHYGIRSIIFKDRCM